MDHDLEFHPRIRSARLILKVNSWAAKLSAKGLLSPRRIKIGRIYRRLSEQKSDGNQLGKRK
jgi:hypothetical protein